jgi:hypothetical protein
MNQIALPEPDGKFRFPAVNPGSYEVRLLGDPGHTYYLESVKPGEMDILGKQFDLQAGTLPLWVTYSPRAGRILGTVEKYEGCAVAVLPRDEALRNWRFIRTAVCSRAGSFEAGGLRPGDYFVFAFDNLVESWALEDASFLRIVLPYAERVHIGAGESVSIQLKVTPWPEQKFRSNMESRRKYERPVPGADTKARGRAVCGRVVQLMALPAMM